MICLRGARMRAWPFVPQRAIVTGGPISVP